MMMMRKVPLVKLNQYSNSLKEYERQHQITRDHFIYIHITVFAKSTSLSIEPRTKDNIFILYCAYK